MASTALSRTAPALAAALTAALLLALAGPVGAAPSASPAANGSACAKATKKLRAAKSRLKAVQRQARRGSASRARVAKAPRAVKNAERAKRKACAAPAKPGVVPPATPPAAPPPSGGGSSDPAPSPPPPPPPAPSETSHALIEKALEEGRIDQETALRYRVFAEFGDPRLPAELRGAPLGETHTRTLDEVAPHPWDPEGQGMTGSETQNLGHVTIEHDWSLSRKSIGP